MKTSPHSTLKYILFNTRVAGTSLVVFLILAAMILEIATTRDFNTVAYNGIIFVFVLIFGILLVQGVLKEVKLKDQIEQLVKEVQRSYELEKRAYGVEKKARLELENLDKTKNQFLLLIQHNLRTPLTSMMGYSDLLLNGTFGKMTKKTSEVVGKFQISTKNLIEIVNDFLDITQFQLGKDVLNTKAGTELAPIIDEIIGELKEKADAKKVTLVFEKPQHKFAIKADREKLKAALTNIIDNAIKYTLAGGVSISVQSNGGVKIIVKDTGIGISAENLKTLFNRIFERGDRAKKAAFTGSGIGLYLASQIIKYHNGKIWAESEGEDKGSTFYIEFPKNI